MDITIIYFSQTGNTFKVARAIADTFREEDHYVQLTALKKANPDDATIGDLLGIGTPCFSSRAPQPVMQFLAALPEIANRKVFMFATSGGAPGRVLYDIAKSLRSKGADVLAGQLTRGKVHHPAPSLIGRFPGRPNAEDIHQVQGFARAIITSLSDPSVGLPRSNLSLIRHNRGFYEFLGSVISDQYVRAFLPEPKLDIANCDQCGSCSQECPMHNIQLEPYPVLGDDCIRCYHCYNQCPNDAFTLRWMIGNPLLWLLYNPVLERFFGDLKPGERIY